MMRHALSIAVLLLLATMGAAQTIVDYRGIDVQSPDPTGAAGLRIQNNFKELADRVGPCNLTAEVAPTVNDDVDEGYYVGSVWYDTVGGVVYWCADNTDGAAVWLDLSTSGGSASISDVAYGVSWDGVTTIAPSKNAVYDYLSSLSTHNAVTLNAAADTLLRLSTQELQLDTQVMNRIFAGPASGADATPTFRALVVNDIPDLSSVYQPYDADLTTWAGVTSSANGRSLVSAADYAAMKVLLAYGTMADQNANSVAITGGTITGITDLAVGDGGTGASTVAAARTNLYTSLYADSVEDIILMVETLAKPGDTVYVAAGTYVLTETLTIPAGVTLAGAGQSSTTITGLVTASLGGSPSAMTIRDLTIDITTTAATLAFNNGVIVLQDVTITGPANGGYNSLTITAAANAVTATLTRVTVNSATHDCIAFNAANQTLGEASTATLTDCVATNPGTDSGVNDNALTTHQYFSITDNGGTYSGTNNQKLITPDAGTAKITLVGTTCGGYCACWSATDCSITMTGVAATPALTLLGTDAKAVRCRVITDENANYAVYMPGDGMRVESCWVSGATGSNANGIGTYSLSAGDCVLLNNRVQNCKYGYSINSTNLDSLTIQNCTEEGGGGNAFRGSVPASFTKGYNTFETAVDTPYGSAGTGDALSTTPQYTSDIPTVGGNLDGNGLATVSLTSSLDLEGDSRFTAGTICRGPRESGGVRIAVNVQGYDSDLAALAGISGVNGDVIIRSGGAWTRLAKGTANQVLKMGADLPAWGTDTDTDTDTLGSIGSVANGDIVIYNSGWTRLAKGDDGQFLKLASGLPSWSGIAASNISDQNAGTDITADLEEESHASEHAVGGADTVFPADPNEDRVMIWDDAPGNLAFETAANVKTLLSLDNVANVELATKHTFGITIDGAGSAVGTGAKAMGRIPFAGTITKVTVLGDVSATAVVDIWIDDFANGIPTVDDTIIGGSGTKPNLSAGTTYEDASLTNWATTSVTAGQNFRFNVDSNNNATIITVIVEITRS